MPLAAFCSDFLAASSAPPGDVDLGARGERFCQLSLGEIHLRAGGVARLCHLLLPLLRARPCCSSRVNRVYSSSASVREAFAALTPAGPLDALLDVVIGQFQ